MRQVALLILLLLLALPARAEDAHPPVPKPPELNGVITAATPYSDGVYDYYLIRIYEESLWTDAPAWSMDTPFALSLHYELDIPQETLVNHMVDEMKLLDPFPPEQAAAYKTELLKLYPAIKSGDIITAIYLPSQEMDLYRNGALLGKTSDMLFARRFLGMWLSPRTIRSNLQRHTPQGN